MRAIIQTAYGSPEVLQLREVDVPVPGAEQVLVRVRAAAVNPLDWHYIRGVPYLVRMESGLRKPRTGARGVDLAGVVEAVGEKVTALRPGDEVYGNRTGAFAEYAVASPTYLARKPSTVSFEEAAAVPVAGVTALQALREHADLRSGQSILINGAAGGVGTFAVQIARSIGAAVTAVCSTRNVELVRSLGADTVIDYTQSSFPRGGERYDVVLDLIGNHSIGAIRRVTKRDGVLVLCSGGSPKPSVLGPMWRVVKAKLLSPFVPQKVAFFLADTNTADLTHLAQMIDTGSLRVVIDRTYPLSATADAIRYLERGHARGKVVITV